MLLKIFENWLDIYLLLYVFHHNKKVDINFRYGTNILSVHELKKYGKPYLAVALEEIWRKRKLSSVVATAKTRNFLWIYTYSKNNAGNNLFTIFHFHSEKLNKDEGLKIIYSQQTVAAVLWFKAWNNSA